ncbi:diguanylate cyclase (GGDEF)-like protein [Sinobacterium caligoides]|uniref:diguanylate cyclase n=1 Tax=Sinobacterium caligoides TaxID=933926 RepID=A0A3N2DYH9_9GAMM|nr:sensor domain-containing diguanylate cyclase [Sinobacterium caligoides]ROS04827.1 diguanylate cyclase (GGDEF)-like protein [Sinobacterium caligoides]
MKMTPAMRITLGVVSLTISVILVADFIGLIPRGDREATRQRQQFVEMLAVQLSVAVARPQQEGINSLLLTAVSRNDGVLSAAMRRSDGQLLAIAGDHQRLWQEGRNSSTVEQMLLPVVLDQRRYGQVEVVFKPLPGFSVLGVKIHGLLLLVVFVGFTGGLFYWLLIRRSLRYLDPNAVIPDRVRNALDVLTNGVLILDKSEQVVLFNQAFSDKACIGGLDFYGHKPSVLHWRKPNSGERIVAEQLPWCRLLQQRHGVQHEVVELVTGAGKVLVLTVNCSLINDDRNRVSGVMVSFDDITEIEHKNKVLSEMLEELGLSKQQVESQNRELQYLASHDALTACLNRGAFNQCSTDLFTESVNAGEPLSCIMVDIDNFKQVNDNYGHAMGDSIIKAVVAVLQKTVRQTDTVGRYGGEEFSILLPNTTLEDAVRLAERCREAVEAAHCEGLAITCSFGVAAAEAIMTSPEPMINRADEALYQSKHNGRNCVTQAKAASGQQASRRLMSVDG